MHKIEIEGDHKNERLRQSDKKDNQHQIYEFKEEDLPPGLLYHHQMPLSKYCSRKWHGGSTGEEKSEEDDIFDSAFALTKIFRKRQRILDIKAEKRADEKEARRMFAA